MLPVATALLTEFSSSPSERQPPPPTPGPAQPLHNGKSLFLSSLVLCGAFRGFRKASASHSRISGAATLFIWTYDTSDCGNEKGRYKSNSFRNRTRISLEDLSREVRRYGNFSQATVGFNHVQPAATRRVIQQIDNRRACLSKSNLVDNATVVLTRPDVYFLADLRLNDQGFVWKGRQFYLNSRVAYTVRSFLHPSLHDDTIYIAKAMVLRQLFAEWNRQENVRECGSEETMMRYAKLHHVKLASFDKRAAILKLCSCVSCFVQNGG